MKKIAIISPCILPIPSTMGGAVEGLISRIIDDNEQQEKYIIDLFSIVQVKETEFGFSSTTIIPVNLSRATKLIDKLSDKCQRMFYAKSSFRTADKVITECLFERLDNLVVGYDALIIENMMSTACAIVDLCHGRYDFPIYFHMHNDVDM
jgi:hypothetical protein